MEAWREGGGAWIAGGAARDITGAAGAIGSCSGAAGAWTAVATPGAGGMGLTGAAPNAGGSFAGRPEADPSEGACEGSGRGAIGAGTTGAATGKFSVGGGASAEVEAGAVSGCIAGLAVA